ncbi:MAG: winged helix-turn-helix transcriptional regulator [Paracoccus denitrificans]|uniref:Winged helix-turn-helix transcriptional regulator n=1 Tax=Paracoccus denitrificans TaxID=266 RepID=A0A533I6M9_PARDE|nr:MAG: winged helix-turn-helix transcriptional regulator [Paracoccus denitrificans]
MDELTDLPGHLIRRLNQLAVGAFVAETKAAGFDLTPVQYGSLATIFSQPDIDQATLAGLVAYDRVTIGGVVGRLEDRGYLTRSVRDDDRRARRLSVTTRGESVVQTIQPAVRAAQEQILSPLDEAERVEFMRLLHKLTAT